MKKHSALALLALFGIACADSTAPSRTLLPSGVSLAVTTNEIDFQNGGTYPTGVADGYVVLCKTGDAAGEFTFNVSVNDGVPFTVQRTLDGPGDVDCGTGPVFTSALIGNTGFDKVEITEDSQDNWSLTGIDIVQHVSKLLFDNGEYPVGSLDDDDGTVTPGQATAFVNGDMARTVTFTNDFTAPPSTGCTYTKGWYQNKNGSPTVIDGIDGRSKADAQAIFKATPGKPGSVTWEGGNNTLNLYQQLLAALNNLGGDSPADIANAPAPVQAAINAALGATGGTGQNITLAAGTNVGGLTGVLASFNEGDFTGWPHCGDDKTTK